MRDVGETPGWLGEAGLTWNVLLEARVTRVPDARAVEVALDAVSRAEGWPIGHRVTTLETRGALAALAIAAAGSPVDACLTPSGVVVRADHAYVDGLGLLAVLAQVSRLPLVSRARGVDQDRPRTSVVRSIAARLVEIAVRPSRLPAPSATRPGQAGDAFARAEVAGSVRTTDLVHAAAGALAEWNAQHDRRGSRISVAVGVSRAGGATLAVGDDSGFLRLTGVERLNREQVDRAVATAPLQFGGGTGNRSVLLARLIRWGAKVLARRLGSTVLVSHLGRVECSGLHDLSFYPIAGGGAGLSLGCATVGDHSVVTLRARGDQHDDAGLAALLVLVTHRLG